MQETLDAIIKDLRRKPVVFGYKETKTLADRLEAALELERANWREKIDAGMEVADAFKKELDHVLNLICYRQQTLSISPTKSKKSTDTSLQPTLPLC